MSGQQGENRNENSLLLDIWQRQAIIEAQLTHVIKGQDEALASRRGIHDKLEAFGLVSHTVKRLEPIVVDLDKLRQQAIGVSVLMKFLWAGFGLFAGGIGMMVQYWLGHPK